jgi:hypothetical protein
VPQDISIPYPGLARLQLELKIEQQTVQILSQAVQLDRAVFKETVYGPAVLVITLSTTTIDYVDRVLNLNQASGTPLMRWRLGFGSGSDTQWLPWQLYYVRGFTARQEGIGDASGHYVVLQCEDLLSLADRGNRTVAYRGTISQIVQRIFAGADTVVEPTSGDGVWYQSYQSDFNFVRSRLVRMARSAKGRGNYLFFARDNVVHFHSPEYQPNLLDLAYSTSGGMRLEQLDLSQKRVNTGAAGVRLVLHDPYSGVSKEIVSDPSRSLRFANFVHRLDSIAGGDLAIMWHLGANRPEEPENLAQNTYESARQECFEMRLTVDKLYPARAGDILRVTVNPKSSEDSRWSGAYLVTSASHAFIQGTLNSVYELKRGEYSNKPTVNPDIARTTNALSNPQQAQGVPINLRSVQDSALTRSSGKSLTGGVYLTTQDPNKAPIPPM